MTATTVDGGSVATAASTSGTVHVDVTPVADVGFVSPVLAVSTDANGNHFASIFNYLSIDANGAEVVFADTGPGAVGGISSQVFAKNLETGSLTLVSRGCERQRGGPCGRTNRTGRTDLGDVGRRRWPARGVRQQRHQSAPNPTGVLEIFVKNIVTGQVILANTDAGGVLLAGGSADPPSARMARPSRSRTVRK